MSRRLTRTMGPALVLIAWLLLGPAEFASATPSPAPADSASPQSAGPHAYDRLDRVGAGLAKSQLFVDPDLDFALDTAQRARISATLRTAQRRIGAPIYIVVIPNAAGADPDGRSETFLFDLHDRMRQNGLYVLADQHGELVDLPFQVHRGISSMTSFDGPGVPADIHNPWADLSDRLVKVLDDAGNAPSAEPTAPSRVYSPLPDMKPPKAHLWSNFFLGLLLVGPVAAFLPYWMGRRLETFAGRFRPWRTGPVPGAHPDAPTRPTSRWLHATATEELQRLSTAISAGPPGTGRAYAMRAYDVGAILLGDLDSAEATKDDDADRILDLVGVIVLARLGRAGLTGETDHPAPPCYINPLHGPSDGSKTIVLYNPYYSVERRPLCRRCWRRGRTADPMADFLTVPGPDGPIEYILVPGFWSETGFGTDTVDLIPRLLEHLGQRDA